MLHPDQNSVSTWYMLQLGDPAWTLQFLWVKLWWSLSCTGQQHSSSIAFCCSPTQVPSCSSSAINPHSFPCHFLTQTYPWLPNPSPLQILSVFSQSPFAPYFHHHSTVNTWKILGLAFSLFEYGHFSNSTSFLRARQTHVSLFPEPWFSAILPFSFIVFPTPLNIKILGDKDQTFTSQWFLQYLKQFRAFSVFSKMLQFIEDFIAIVHGLISSVVNGVDLSLTHRQPLHKAG